MEDISPLCLLDFYVHESVQRLGHDGRDLFEEMLKREGILQPGKIAYDRPSSKMLAFLAKHYNLRDYVPQVNKYVVFRQYWDSSVNFNNEMQIQDQQHIIGGDRGSSFHHHQPADSSSNLYATL